MDPNRDCAWEKINRKLTELGFGIITGGVSFSELKVVVGSAELCYGNFIQNIVNFLLIALTMFLVVKSINKMHKEEKKAE